RGVVPTGNIFVTAKAGVVAAECDCRGQLQRGAGALREQVVDLRRVLRRQNGFSQIPLDLVDITIEITVRKLDCAMMQLPDDKDDHGGDQEPSPLRNIK